jgi:hypothetical protein
MGGDSAVRSLLEKMTECASGAYLRMLERFVILYSFFLVHLVCMQLINCLLARYLVQTKSTCRDFCFVLFGVLVLGLV